MLSARLRPPPAAPRRGCVRRARAEPFAAPAAPASPAPAPPAGFLAAGADRSAALSLPLPDADALLSAFDAASLAAQRARAPAPPPPPPGCHPPALRAACAALAARSGAVMLGLCADSADGGVAALRAWASALGLPRRLLHGLDRDGQPLVLDGPVFIKYNSATGDAVASGYEGPARGVLFTPSLPDGAFRQYGYLPLGLFGGEGEGSG